MEEGDLITTPGMTWHGHRNQGSDENPSDEAGYPFSLSDRPVLEALGLYREEEP